MTISIAVVDDDETILDAMQSALQSVGWNVRTYRSGETFLDELSDFRPDCLILDPHLAGVDGPEVARSVTREFDHIPIIGLTANPESPVVKEVLQVGAQVMLTKPVSFIELMQHLNAAIDQNPVESDTR